MIGLAAGVSAWTGRSIPYRDIPASEYKKALLESGLPDAFAEFFVAADLAIARGDLESSRRDLHELIGRDTETLRDALARAPKP